MGNDDNQTEAKSRKPSRVFLANVALIGSLASIISVPMAVYFYNKSKETRKLTFYTHPIKTIVFNKQQTPSLSIFHENAEVNSSVTGVQIAVWNDGKKSIRRENILQPIILATAQGEPILESHIKTAARKDITKLEVARKGLADGQIELTWDILEHNDGGILQILYAGGPGTQIEIKSGTIEGQPALDDLTFSGTIKSPSQQYADLVNTSRTLLAPTSLISAILLLISLILLSRKMKRNEKSELSDYIAALSSAMIFIISVYYLFRTTSLQSVPFEF